ncbi:MAG: TPM domain-containing protein [Oscillospiraceae bacterium]|nr:TPM domain-containing protein [Oscillospiraceae bacterium]MBR4655121.1 TPM domain-containing protein [Oscillospiraceae bacterium]
MKRFHTAILAGLLVLLLLSLCCGTVCAVDQSLSGNPLVVDNAGLLSETERQALEQQARNISNAHSCEVIILTVNGSNGKSPRDYAEDYYVDHKYGFGSEQSGIMLYLDMGERDWYIATCGSAIEAFHDDPTDFLVSRFKPDLADGNYGEAFETYLDYSDKFLGVYDGTLPKDKVDELNQEYENYLNGTEPSKPNYVRKGIFSVILGALAGFVPVTSQKSALKTVRRRRDASGYARAGSLNLNVNRDIYLYSNVTSHVIEQPRSEGGGHSISSGSSSTHTHSSGTTFGGHGGKF